MRGTGGCVPIPVYDHSAICARSPHSRNACKSNGHLESVPTMDVSVSRAGSIPSLSSNSVSYEEWVDRRSKPKVFSAAQSRRALP